MREFHRVVVIGEEQQRPQLAKQPIGLLEIEPQLWARRIQHRVGPGPAVGLNLPLEAEFPHLALGSVKMPQGVKGIQMKFQPGGLQPLRALGEVGADLFQLIDFLELRRAQILGRKERHLGDTDALAGGDEFGQMLVPRLGRHVVTQDGPALRSTSLARGYLLHGGILPGPGLGPLGHKRARRNQSGVLQKTAACQQGGMSVKHLTGGSGETRTGVRRKHQ